MQDLARSVSHLIETSRLSIFLQNLKNEVPITQSAHLIGLCFLIGSAAIIDLRVLGLMNSDQSVRSVARRFMPPLWGGLALMGLSGLVMLLTEPSRALPAVQFQVKMALLLVALAVTLTLNRAIRRSDADFSISPSTRVLAGVSMALWAAIIAAGRWIAYA